MLDNDTTFLIVLAVSTLIASAVPWLVAGWWLSRKTRRRDSPIDLDDDTAAQLRAERRAEWGRKGSGDDV